MALVVLACAVGTIALSVMIRSKGLNWTAELATIGALVVPVIALFSPVVRKWWNAPDPVSQLSCDEAIERLSPVLLAQWSERNNERQVHDPGAMRVEFKVTRFTESLMTTVSLGGDASTGESLRPDGLSGDFDSILDVFRKVQRLVITGPAGSGKSVLAIKLACDLSAPEAQPRQPADLRLPLILQASAWKPGESLDQWIISELTNIDPELSLRPRTAVSKDTLAQAMVPRVIPIIDGIDELPAAQRGAAVSRIIEAGSDRPLVVTSRPAEYSGALAAARREISRAAVVEMQSLTLHAVRRYLREAATLGSLPRWQLVFEQLDSAPDGPLATVLTNPLMLWLCRRIYSEDHRDPRELARSPGLGSRRAIEDHLLGAFLPAIYRDSAGRPSPWTAAQARQWLGFLAVLMEKTRSPDLAWWRLRTTVEGWRSALMIVRGASLSALVCWLAVWVLRRAGDWRGGHYTGRVSPEKLLLGGPAGQAIRPGIHRLNAILMSFLSAPAPARRISWLPPIWHAHDIYAIINIVPWPVYVIVPGTVVFVSYSRDHDVGWRAGPVASVRLARSAIRTLGSLVGQLVIAVGTIELILRLPHQPVAGKGSALLGLFVLAVILISVFSVPECFRPGPAELYSAKSPVMALRDDRKALMCIAAVLLVPIAAIWCCCGTGIGLAVSAFGCAFLLSQLLLGPWASGAFVETRVLLALMHQMPLRTLAFLEDAHQRGALGRTGSTYQFRHLQLQRYLAREHVRPRGRYAPGRLEGLPRFEEQADALAGVIGPCEAAGPVYDEPPGVAQRFGTADGRDWVMCALHGEYPVLVPDPIWSLLHHVRAAAGDGDALQVLGFPVLPDTTPAGERLIAPDASTLTLAGGALGPATLERAGDGDHWRWCPQESTDFTERLSPRWGNYIGHVHVDVRLPCELAGPAVKPQSFADQLETSLSQSEFSSVMHALGPSEKRYPKGSSAYSTYRYRWRTSAGSAPPARAVIRVHFLSGLLNVGVELDIAAGEHPRAGGRFRLGLSLRQLQAVLWTAWQAAADVVPGEILNDPLASLTARPLMRLSLSAPSTPGEILRLHPRQGDREAQRARPRRVTERTVTISGPVIGLSDAERERYIRDALARLAPGFGYRLTPGG